MVILVVLLFVIGLVVKIFNKVLLKENFMKYGYVIILLDMVVYIVYNLFYLLVEGKLVFYIFIELFGVNVVYIFLVIFDDLMI